MSAVRDETSDAGTVAKKPCEVFDIICGTSTGGLVAILLGCLKLTVKEAIDEYEQLSKEVFGAPKSKKPGRESKYSATNFEKVIKRLTKKYGGSEEATLLQAPGDVSCRVFVCTQQALAIDPRHPYLMRSYEASPAIDGLTVWQAARATSAAPTFFKRLKIGNHEFIDGGIGSNNPSKALLKETQRIFRREPGSTVSCLVNLGTGVPKDIGFKELSGTGIGWLRDVIRTLKSMATDCEETAEEMAALFKSTPNFYFRFNVEQGMQGVEMDKHEDLNVVGAKTVKYMAKDVQQERLLLAAQVLASNTPAPTAGSHDTNKGNPATTSETEVPLRVIELAPTSSIQGSKTSGPITVCLELSRCPHLTSDFCGREAILDELSRTFDYVPRRAILWGFPGSGKTAIALRYRQLFKDKYNALIWINASSQATVLSSFSEAMMSVTATNTTPQSASEPRDFIRRWLEKSSKEWLMIVDSMDDLEEINVRDLLPECSHGTVLITSSKSSLAKALDFTAIEVKELDDDAGCAMLLTQMGGSSAAESVRKEALAIVRQLHGLPLAIEQAGALLRKGYPLQDFQQMLTKNMEWVLRKKPKTSEWTYDRNRCVHAILDMLTVQLANEDENAPSVLSWISLLGPGEIFINAMMPIEAAAGQEAGLVGDSWAKVVGDISDLPQLWTQLTDVVTSPGRFWMPLAALEDFCMLKIRRNSQNQISSVELHSMVRYWAFERLSDTDREFGIFFATYGLSRNLDRLDGEVPSLFMHRRLNATARHLVSLLRTQVHPSMYSPDDGRLSHLHRMLAGRLAHHFIHMNQHREAQEMLQHAIEYEMSLQQSQWPSDETSLRLIEALGDCYRVSGQFGIAEDAYTDLLENVTSILGDADPFTLRAAGKLREIRIQIDVDNSSRKRVLESNPSGKQSITAMQIIAIGADASNAHSVEEEVPFDDEEYGMNEVVRQMRAEFGPYDTEYLDRLYNLGLYYYGQGKFAQAAAPFTECFIHTTKGRRAASRYKWEPSLGFLLECYDKAPHSMSLLPELYRILLFAVEVNDLDLCTSFLRDSMSDVATLKDVLYQALRRKQSGSVTPSLHGVRYANGLCYATRSPLSILSQAAAIAGNLAAVEWLFGDDLEADRPDSCQCLNEAAAHGHLEVVRFLLKIGADPNSPIYDASRWASYENMDLRAEDKKHNRDDHPEAFRTPLLGAAAGDHLDVVELLIREGAELGLGQELFEGVRSTPFLAAVSKGGLEVAKFLFDMQSGTNSCITKHELTHALLLAAAQQDSDMTRYLLKQGAIPDYDLREKCLPTPLILATVFDDIVIMQLLLESGADPNLRSHDKDLSPLLEGVCQGTIDAVAFLLRNGADPDGKTCQRVGLDQESPKLPLVVTPLTAAVKFQRLPVVKLLLEQGADPNIAAEHDGHVFTPLCLATLDGESEIAGLLIQWGATDPYHPGVGPLPLWDVDLKFDGSLLSAVLA